MGLKNRYDDERVNQEAIQQYRTRLQWRSRQAQLAQQSREEERRISAETALLAEFLPLFKALDARKHLKDLVMLWMAGRVDQKPEYSPNGDYASLSWRKRYWHYGPTGSSREGSFDNEIIQEEGVVASSLLFTVDVRKIPTVAFRTASSMERGNGWGQNGMTEWQGFSLGDPGASNALLRSIFHQTRVLTPPQEAIEAMRYRRGATIETSSYTSPETRTRHPFLLRLGIPDFDYPR